FYAKGEFVYVGKCILKKQSQELATHLWGNVPKKNDTWEYMFFLDEIRPISIPLSRIINLSEYKEKMIVQGFTPINELGLNNIINKYGSIVSFFDSYSSGIQTKNAITLDELSQKETLNEEDLEKIDRIFLKGNSNIILKEFEQRLSNEKPDVVETKVKRIKRNLAVVKNMKEKYNNKCQICGFTFKKKDGSNYSEVAHIKPIHSLETGVDKPSNMVVLCPNHHKMYDLGNLSILSKIKYKIDDETKDFLQTLF
ncbi:MAG: HNH endonuclease, partial [Parachlamydiales bacterium]